MTLLSNCTPRLCLLAEVSPFEHLGEHFRGERVRLGGDDLVAGLAIIAFAVGCVWLLRRCLSKTDRFRRCNNPRTLFRSLCRAHRLDWRSRQLLRRLARSQNIEPPARVFLERNAFAPERLDARLSGDLPRIEWLRERLFARNLESDANVSRDNGPSDLAQHEPCTAV